MKHYGNSQIVQWLKGFMLKHMHNMMTCKEFEDFVRAYVDDELPARQRSKFELHMRLCQECRQYLQAYQRTVEVSRAVLSTQKQPIPDDVPEDLVKAILKARKL